jgi:hypothetical protein
MSGCRSTAVLLLLCEALAVLGDYVDTTGTEGGENYPERASSFLLFAVMKSAGHVAHLLLVMYTYFNSETWMQGIT